jgi:hypothetical protein
MGTNIDKQKKQLRPGARQISAIPKKNLSENEVSNILNLPMS